MKNLLKCVNKIIANKKSVGEEMELSEIKRPEDVYQFLDDNIEYGWIDINGKQHLNTMKDFREYIEQCQLMKY